MIARFMSFYKSGVTCGKQNEDANAHLQNFLELCDNVVIRGVTGDVVKLRLFPFSLLGKAK